MLTAVLCRDRACVCVLSATDSRRVAHCLCHNIVAGRWRHGMRARNRACVRAMSTADGCALLGCVCKCCGRFGCTGGEQDRRDEWGSHGGTVSHAKVSLDTDSQCDSTRFSAQQ